MAEKKKAPVLVSVYGISAPVRPSGLCALLIPHSDSERGLTTQQSLDEMPRHQLALFAAVQAVEWGLDFEAGFCGTQQAVKWKAIFLASSKRLKGAKRGR